MAFLHLGWDPKTCRIWPGLPWPPASFSLCSYPGCSNHTDCPHLMKHIWFFLTAESLPLLFCFPKQHVHSPPSQLQRLFLRNVFSFPFTHCLKGGSFSPCLRASCDCLMRRTTVCNPAYYVGLTSIPPLDWNSLCWIYCYFTPLHRSWL